MWLAATLEAIAIPIAPPSCWVVFSSPDASPASVLLDARERGDRDRDERERGPGAGDHERAGEVRRGSGRGRAPGWPRARRRRSASSRSPSRPSAPPRVTRHCERPASATDVSDVASHARAGLKRAVVQHLLHVQRADEDEREEAAAEQQPRHVRAGERSAGGRSTAAGSGPSPGSRSLGSATSSAAAAASTATVLVAPHPYCGACEIA